MKKSLFILIFSLFTVQHIFCQLIGFPPQYYSPLQPNVGDTLRIKVGTSLQHAGSPGPTCGNFYLQEDTVINNQLIINVYYDICYVQSLAWCGRDDTLAIPIHQNNLQSVKIYWNLKGTTCLVINPYVADSASFLLNTTSLASYEKKPELNVFPNPIAEQLFVNHSPQTQLLSLLLFNSRGQLVKRLPANQNSHNIADLPKGVYFLKAEHKNGIETEKIIKR